jgi:hypothetical protein
MPPRPTVCSLQPVPIFGRSPGAAFAPAAATRCSTPRRSYLRFTQAGRLPVEDRIPFMHWAGRVMRCVIVDFARGRLAVRRGGGVRRVTLTVQLPSAALAGEQADPSRA